MTPAQKRTLIGAAIGVVAFYFVATFITADFTWPRGIFSTWDGRDRAAFLYLVTCAGGLGALVSRWQP